MLTMVERGGSTVNLVVEGETTEATLEPFEPCRWVA